MQAPRVDRRQSSGASSVSQMTIRPPVVPYGGRSPTASRTVDSPPKCLNAPPPAAGPLARLGLLAHSRFELLADHGLLLG